jgi:hypothetical protein
MAMLIAETLQVNWMPSSLIKRPVAGGFNGTDIDQGICSSAGFLAIHPMPMFNTTDM